MLILSPKQIRNKLCDLTLNLACTTISQSSSIGNLGDGSYLILFDPKRCLIFDARSDFKILLVTYKIMHGLAPSYLESVVIPYQQELQDLKMLIP